MKMLLIVIYLATMAACSVPVPIVSSRITDTTVMVTNLAQTSGGSGTVVSNELGLSTVLTNAHVCGVVKHGGLITTTTKVKATVAYFQVSETHDLCLITVYEDLLHSAKLSDRAPSFHEKATISGHPALYPNVVTQGHFSENKIVQVMYGFRACTDAERQDPVLGVMCALVGGIPLVKNYESTLVTATIMAGSSGSGIFDSNGHLGAVVFAGSGDLSYALAVPYGYLRDFLTRESKILPHAFPETDLSFGPSNSDEHRRQFSIFAEVCAKNETLRDLSICKYTAANRILLGE